MPGLFEPLPGGGAAVALDPVEISIIRSLAVQLLELIGPGPGADSPQDPLAELFADGPSEPPADPVLKRLFPDAYSDPEEAPHSPAEAEEWRAHSAEFRRYTENDLRAGKRDNALAVIRALDALAPDEGGAVLKLTPQDSQRWLGALNDLRLAIGIRLEIADDDDTDLLYGLPDEDPRKPMVMAYLWLGGLQETLVHALMP
ncbi:DUF2017 domain-containing protein [Streptomyces sp. NPDC048304]|uniref:DUF2017 domain-containing protein n=1 Tax=Streptomyces sp. NPDC048304 TaxID=3154820 RepID=UPI0033C1CE7B